MEDHTRSTRLTARRHGFTLIEVLIVLAIVLLLGGLVGVTLFQRRDQADVDFAKVDLNTLTSGLENFRFDFRRYPTDEEGITVLWDKEQLDPEAATSTWKGPYLTQPLVADRWGNEWGYRQLSENIDIDDEETAGVVSPFDLWSNGPDGEEGTDDDINSWSAAGGGVDEFGSDLLPPGDG